MDSVQSTPPTTFQSRKVLAGICRVPATGLRKVRTIGMKRASTTALAGPNFSKYSSAFSTYSGRKIFEFGLSNIFGPTFRPSRCPSWAPAIAQSGAPISSRAMFIWAPSPSTAGAALEAATPARMSMESPGKKNPTSRPVSAKMIARIPMAPTEATSDLASRTLTASWMCSTRAG